MVKIFNVLGNLFRKPASIPAEIVKSSSLTGSQKELIRQIASYSKRIKDSLLSDMMVNFERLGIYREVDRALSHWMMSAAAELYADVSTTYSGIQNATVWVESENSLYRTEIEKLLENIGVEEKIFDWAWNIASYGDLFVEPEAQPGIGVVSVNDSYHPINISRVDYGVLLGFYLTPFANVSSSSSATCDLLPPWKFVHFRLLGAKRRRTQGQGLSDSRVATTQIISIDNKQLTSQYGTSLLLNGLYPYKKLRLAEDSLLLARATKGVLKYIYKIRVDSENIEAVAEIVDSYKAILKEARAIDTSSSGDGYFESRTNLLSAMEDIILPVWENSDDITIEEIGGKTDIRWIADIEEFRNQLACALRVPLSMLGGFVKEASGALGSQAIEKLDIRFARSARRVQRSLIEGLTRLAQIHLAYLGMNPSTSLFTLKMNETSTAEEESIRESLDSSTNIITNFMSMLDAAKIKDLNRADMIDYLTKKLLRLSDFDLHDYINTNIKEDKKIESRVPNKRRAACNLDFKAALPELDENSKSMNETWKYSGKKVEVKEKAVVKAS
jgi:hypothetical protein